MGPVQPPQRKRRLPQYAPDKMVQLQEKFDDLESQGIFQPPESVGVTVEYLNPSFLVKKPNGGHRLVTAFADVGRYSKPQPSLLPDVDSTLRAIAKWKYIIVTDLTSAFYQIPLAKTSMKYCGVVTLSAALECTLAPPWVCPGQRQPSKNSCAAYSVIVLKMVSLLNLQMTCIAVLIPQKSSC